MCDERVKTNAIECTTCKVIKRCSGVYDALTRKIKNVYIVKVSTMMKRKCGTGT